MLCHHAAIGQFCPVLPVLCVGTHVRNAAFALFGKIVAHTARRFTQYDATTDRIDRSLPNAADFFEIANGDVPKLNAFKDQFSICVLLKDDKQELGGRQVIIELRLFPFRLLAQLDKVKRRERHTLLDRSVATDADRFGNDTCLFKFVRLRDPAMDAEHLAKEDIIEVFRRLLYAKELLQFALRQYGVAAPTGVRAEYGVGPVGHLRVEVACAAFGCYDVVLATDFINVRAFVARQSLLGAHALLAELHRLALGLARLAVKAHYAQAAVVAPLGFALGALLIYNVCLPVVVEEEGRVDAVDGRQPHWVAPVVFHGVLGMHIEVAATHVGGEHIVCLGLRVVVYVWGVYASLAHLLPGKLRQLRWAVEHVAHERPVHEVAAVVERHSGVVAEGRCHQPVVLTHAAQGGVGVESGNYGVKEAKGKYIIFIDADDYFHQSVLKKVIEYLSKNELDILMCDFARETEIQPNNNIILRFPNSKILSGHDFLLINSCPFGPCKYFFLKDLMCLNQIFFEENVCCEDVDWVHKLTLAAKKIQYQPILLSHVIINEQSQTANEHKTLKPISEKFFAGFRMIQLAEQFKEDKEVANRLKAVAYVYYIQGLKYFAALNANPFEKAGVLKKYIPSQIKDFPKRIIYARKFSYIYSILTNATAPIVSYLILVKRKWKAR